MRNPKNTGDGKKFGRKPQSQEKSFQSEPRKLSVVKKGDEQIRLNRYIANSGICSRREADKLIASGEITVNGAVVTELGAKVSKRDEVLYKGEALNVEKKVYLLLNKPRGFVTTLDDPHAEHTVMELVDNACPERIYPVGRLDKETSGVLLFTNDGDLAKKLTHPSYEKKKIYHVFLNIDFSEEHMEQIKNGIELEDGFIKADSISFVDPADKKQVGIEIHSGRNRIVRRIFAHFDYKVARLDRVFFAGLTKKNLPRGKWRFLSPKEISYLKMN
ncbi:pseudouridine synthase [Mangrovibacterium diazotrophicum]|nr:pseudouridine synthase [Mangrovibacterium diazotrophicum]